MSSNMSLQPRGVVMFQGRFPTRFGSRASRYGDTVDHLTRTALAARDGDRIALEGFLRLVQADVWKTCRYMVDAQSADDLTQDVLVKIVGSMHRITADHNVRGWVLGIARHTCLDEIRRRQRRRRLQSDFENTRPSVVADLGSSVAVQDLVERLDPERRDAFVLTQLVGLSYEETAAICDCPVGTVRSRVARARMDLQSLIDARETGTLPPPQATGTS
jgi:RNA polymerase sigma-70 factor (ECF subfamily)